MREAPGGLRRYLFRDARTSRGSLAMSVTVEIHKDLIQKTETSGRLMAALQQDEFILHT